ncbi:MAG: type VII toxin-antitoxin system HepT family RNase toxin [Fusobacteriota bacterium]
MNKVESIERCVRRIKKIYNNDDSRLEEYLYQDAIILNIQRACQQTIDLAMYIVSKKGFGVPKSSKDAFILLENNNILTAELSKKMQGMTGFRNIAIHQYQELDLDIVKFIIKKGLDDFLEYNKKILKMID